MRAALIVNSRRSLALFVDFADFSPALFPFNSQRKSPKKKTTRNTHTHIHVLGPLALVSLSSMTRDLWAPIDHQGFRARARDPVKVAAHAHRGHMYTYIYSYIYIHSLIRRNQPNGKPRYSLAVWECRG